MILRCVRCGLATSHAEAWARLFYAGRCAMCGGELEPWPNVGQNDEKGPAEASPLPSPTTT